MTTLTVEPGGELTLTDDLLRHLGVEPGQEIEVVLLPSRRIGMRAAMRAISIDAFIGLLAGKTAKIVTIEEMNEAAAAGWAGEPDHERDS